MAWGNPQQLGVEQQLCDVFNRENPDVHVSLLRVPGSAYRSKAIVMLATGTAPDVLRIDHYDFPALQEREYFNDLTPFVSRDPSFRSSDFWPQTIEEGTVQGRLYGLNVLFGGILVYYNRTLMRRAGLEDPYAVYKRGAWTWDEFRRYAIALTKPATATEPETFGALIPTTVPVIAPIVWGYGGDLLTPDHKRCLLGEPPAVAALKFLADLRNVDHAAPTVSETGNSAYVFEGGKIGMVFDFMGMAPRYRSVVKSFDWDVAPIPRGPVTGASLVKGNQLVMASCTKNPGAAWRFMRFLTGVDAENLLYAKLRRCFPTRVSVAESSAYLEADAPPFHMRAFIDAVKTGRPLPIDDRWAEW
ncbi:MAG TPA: sugar ABC transporter substrate-binding protein, partial [Fimbriimonadaceae bacterium]|nr:sugar ABC transporter substrate-binding protein [Fimbriimonadaceae bacterium]